MTIIWSLEQQNWYIKECLLFTLKKILITWVFLGVFWSSFFGIFCYLISQLERLYDLMSTLDSSSRKEVNESAFLASNQLFPPTRKCYRNVVIVETRTYHNDMWRNHLWPETKLVTCDISSCYKRDNGDNINFDNFPDTAFVRPM